MVTEDDIRARLWLYTQAMFLAVKGSPIKQNPHQLAICDALERVVIGKTKRLIINIPPRSGKTEIAVKMFISWAMGVFPDAQFIHTSYSKRLATSNAYGVRALMQHEYYKHLFPQTELEHGSAAKDDFRTTSGGIVYAVGAGGTITGYGAGGMDGRFKGCFAYGQMVDTEHGPARIGDIVKSGTPLRVWSYNDNTGEKDLKRVTRFWENGSNDLIEVVMSDGSTIRCTPDHEILTGAGWVSAIHLAYTLNLIDGKACNSGRIRPTDTPVIGDVNDALAMLWLAIPLSVRESLRDTHPCLSGFYLPDDTDSNPIFFGEGFGVVAALEYLNNIFSGENGSRPPLKEGECSVPDSVLHIVGLSAIRQIAKGVIGGVPIKVPDLVLMGSFAYKLLSDEVGDIARGDDSIYRQADPKVTLPITRGFKRSGGVRPSDCTEVRNFVKPLGSSDSFPVFVRYVGHVDSTFCLSVEDNKNFILTQNGAVVSNCIIVDDPHKADEATSEVMRQNTIDWFQTTLESRKNSPETPIVVIKQRLHENDLSGWLLAGGNGEKWECVKIPAIDDDGDSFWPEQFPLDMLRRLETANPYIFAGQYMQNPAPKTGGVFDAHKIEIIDALPAGISGKVRGWDLAATAKGGDWTAGVLLDVSGGFTYIVDIQRIRGSAHDVEQLLVSTAKQDGAGIEQSIPQDPGQAGKAQADYLSKRLIGANFKFSVESGDKATRASPFSAQVNAGNVKMLKAPWNNDILHELRSFPFGSHDDMIDGCSRAFNRIDKPRGGFMFGRA